MLEKKKEEKKNKNWKKNKKKNKNKNIKDNAKTKKKLFFIINYFVYLNDRNQIINFINLIFL